MEKEKIKTPNINLDELKKFKEINFKERLEFIEKYTEWVKKNGNIEWSKQQSAIIS